MEQLIIILTAVYKSVLHVLPWFAISVILAAAINTSGITKTKIGLFMNRHPLKLILIASLLGTLSPFCSCGVIPIITAIAIAGAPVAPIFAFWISSPLMDPEMFIITYGELGLSMAVARLVAAFLMGFSAGLLGMMFTRESAFKEKILNAAPLPASCACEKEVKYKLKNFAGQLTSISLFLGKWLMIAFVLEAIIINYFPSDWIGQTLGRQNKWAIIYASLIGVPLYVNGIGAIPIVKGLLLTGMSKGAALSFLIAGPVTTIPAMVAVTAIARKRLFALYLLISLFGSIAAGYIYQLFN